jgi:hypothetical protein
VHKGIIGRRERTSTMTSAVTADRVVGVVLGILGSWVSMKIITCRTAHIRHFFLLQQFRIRGEERYNRSLVWYNMLHYTPSHAFYVPTLSIDIPFAA